MHRSCWRSRLFCTSAFCRTPSSLHSPQYDEVDDAPSSSLYCKYPSVLPNSWQEVCAERAYIPLAEDVGRALRLECSPILSAPLDATSIALREKAIAEGAVASTSLLNTTLNLGVVVRIDTGAVLPSPLPPPPRVLVYADPPPHHPPPANVFKTVCFNVLAQIYATRQMYGYCPIWALAWDYRKNLLVREILAHNADIICLQEVQSNHFDTFFVPRLSAAGYDGIFKVGAREEA
jgi:CCR4-NOT transcription complex subunit 6